LTASLRKLNPDDGERQMRHAVMPLFAAIVGAPA
jgi:hypothetical protein